MIGVVAKRSTLSEYAATGGKGRDHCDALSTALATFGKGCRAAIDHAEELKDKDTADVFTEISRGTDKWLWFVEAHLQHDDTK